MKRVALLAAILCGVAYAQPAPMPILQQCSATVTTNCTPQVNASGQYTPPAGISACAATPPTSASANLACIGTNGSLYVCGPTTCTSSGQFVVSPGTLRTWPFQFRGIVQAGVAGFAASLPSANAPTPTNAGGTDPAAVLEWPITQSVDYAWWLFELPTGYVSNSAISYSIASRSTDSTDYSILTPYWACVASATVDAPSWTGITPVNITNAAASARTITTGTIIPTCAAGNMAGVKFKIDTNTNSMTAPFDLISVTFTVQGAM